MTEELLPHADANVRKTTLSNGLRIVSEEMPHVRSVAVGIWVGQGSRHEHEQDHGLTHFAEHMVFKGTEERSAEDIACSIDAIGGHLDAFTTKESVAFTAKVLDERLPLALDIVSDMTLRPAFREEDIEKEKGVVLEELKMDEDNPDYLIHDLFSSSFWRGHALGRSIIGTKSSIQAFEQRQLRRFFEGAFQPAHLLVTAAGRLQHDAFVKLVDERFGGMAPRVVEPAAPPPAPTPSITLRDKPALEQLHLYLGVGAHAMADPRRFSAYVLSTLLGGGFSSRLFLKIRERAGLAYAVYSDLNLYADTGYLSVYAGTSLEALPKVLEYVMREFRDVKDNLVPAEELRRAKDHLKGSLMLSLESTSSRMSNLARQEKYFERSFSLDEVVDRIEQVTAEEVRDLAAEWFQQERIAAAVLGDLRGVGIDREQLAC
ncbi:MAG: insulinase family protein [Acidobacteria bacterium]|nr:insulinase family protein [Acidobacteriota bacterium]